MTNSNNTKAAATATQKTYWGPFSYQGVNVDLSHLEPFEFACKTPDDNVRRVRVVFSPHVFTRGAEVADAGQPTCFDERVYCPNRYTDSKTLPTILAGLPQAKVFQTWEKRNYLFLVPISTNGEDPYHVFFELKKEGDKRNKHIALRVESAYRDVASSYVPPSRPNSIRFAMLIQNVFLGRPVKFAAR